MSCATDAARRSHEPRAGVRPRAAAHAVHAGLAARHSAGVRHLRSRRLKRFAGALGGSLAADAAVSSSVGWAAAFIAGALGFFQAASSRGADRRLVVAGLGP